ncbi:hypothetical protein BYT27DRAFT_7205915 [Phlegmacium glaucopus]|nr:hypothetical protein BYT27DRAFT_7205915 [Phlegmacium glaucopus]
MAQRLLVPYPTSPHSFHRPPATFQYNYATPENSDTPAPKRPQKAAGSSIGSAPRLSSTITASELNINLADHPNTSIAIP